jgi:hypothetical protein
VTQDIPQTRTAKVEAFFGDKEHPFRLGAGELIELDEALEIGPHALFDRLSDRTWRVQHVKEVIRVGLIGGGMAPQRAAAFVRRYVDELPDWVRNADLARVVVGAAIFGVEVEPLGKSSGETGTTAPLSPTDASDGATSTGSEPPSA